MRSKAAIGNQPIHPMLVPIPIGAFVLAMIGDVLHIVRPEDPFWPDLSYTCIGVGLIFALTAAVFGAIDDIGVKMSPRTFRLATWHAILNVAVALAYAVSFRLRRLAAGPAGSRWAPAFGFRQARAAS